MHHLFGIILLCLCCSLSAETLDYHIGSNVKVADIAPIGINQSNSSYYSSPMMKYFARENFEGTVYRQCHAGLLQTDGFITRYGTKIALDRWWGKMNLPDLYPGAKIQVISGSAYGQTTTIERIETASYSPYKGHAPTEHVRFVFTDPITLPDNAAQDGMGILIEQDRRNEGCLGLEPDGGYWCSTNVSLMHGDTHPESFGQSVCLLDGTKVGKRLNKQTGAYEDLKKPNTTAYYKFATSWHKFADINGTWHISFKAKALDNVHAFSIDPQLQDGHNKPPRQDIALTTEWESYTATFNVDCFDKVPDKTSHTGGFLLFRFAANGGKVLFDDVTIWNDNDTNPTVFRDDAIEALKNLNPGILRSLAMGGVPSADLYPRLRSYRSTNSITAAVGPLYRRELRQWSMHEHLEICKYLQCSSWYNFRGTFYEEEVDLLIEYLAGPVTTPGGKLRAEQGHPQPWTEVIPEIHLEPGNEAWNGVFAFIAGGYSGPDYWERAFARIKASPYYKDNIILHAAGQHYSVGMTKSVLTETPSADCYTIAPYQVHKLHNTELEQIGDEKDFFKWCLGYSLEHVLGKPMQQQAKAMEAFDCEFSVYEQNWHMTGGDAPLEIRNRFTTSLPAGVGILNMMLLQMRDYGLRYQCFYSFVQHSYPAAGVGDVRLWGSTLSLRPEEFRFRPTGYCLKLINEILQIRGDIVSCDTTQSEPQFEAVHLKKSYKKNKHGKHVAVHEKEHKKYPSLFTYAIRGKNGERGAIVINLSLDTPQKIRFIHNEQIDGTVLKKTLSTNSITDNNEFEQEEAQVVHTEEEITDPATDIITVPPFSLITLQWAVQ